MPQADPKNASIQEQKQTAQTSPYSNPQYFEDETIDLYELWLTLWKGKWLIIAITLIGALGSIGYTLQLQRIYKAETRLLPPKANDLQSFSGIRRNTDLENSISNRKRFLPKEVFKKFIQNLNSRTIHKKFISEFGLMEVLSPERTPEIRDEDIYLGFSKLIHVLEKKEVTYFSIEYHDPELAAQWVNDLTEFVEKETVEMIVTQGRNEIANKIRNIEYTIASKRHMAKQRREDQIFRNQEAAQIAKNLGIKRRVDATNIIQNTQMNVDIATATTPLYYLGFEALMTEVDILKNRKSDDPFITGLRDLQEQLELMNKIKINSEMISSVYIDQPAYPPTYAIKPNRRLIVLITTVAVSFSGIFLVFLIEFVKNQRKKHS